MLMLPTHFESGEVLRPCFEMMFSKGVAGKATWWKLSIRQSSTRKHTLPTQKVQKPMVAIDENDMRESFVRGSGPGGQKINKSKNNVLLVHVPTGISVQCQETRDLCSNRKIARKLLRDKVDLAVNGETSKLGKKFERIRKKKRNSARYQMMTTVAWDFTDFSNSCPTLNLLIRHPQTSCQKVRARRERRRISRAPVRLQ